MGRPTKLNDDVEKRICDLLRVGNFVEPAVRACGIGPSTHFEWMERGKVDPLPENVARLSKGRLLELLKERGIEPPKRGTGARGAVAKQDLVAVLETEDRYRQYREAVEEALSVAETLAVTMIQKAARTEWRAAAFYLERAQPGRWGRRSVRDTEWDPAPEAGGPAAGAAPNARKMAGPDGEPL